MEKKVVREKPHRGWTTLEQFQFLDSRKDDYIQMKSAKGKERNELRAAFWPPLYESWFEKWPVVVANDPEGKRSDEETAQLYSKARLQMETVCSSS